MRKVALLSCLILITLPAMADILPCETLRNRVDAKFQAKGMQNYTLEIEPISGSSNNAAASAISGTNTNKGKVVGTCDGGTKRLLYTRGN